MALVLWMSSGMVAYSHRWRADSVMRATLAQRTVVAPVVNAYAVQHVAELVQGVGVKLSRAQLAEIAKAAQ